MNKLLEEHGWLLNDDLISNIPLPIKNESIFDQKVKKAIPPSNPKDIWRGNGYYLFRHRMKILH